MTNREIIANYNGLDYIQSLEAEHYKRTGEKLFQGRVKITYAIKKNMRELLDKLKPYDESRNEIFAEYRDLDSSRFQGAQIPGAGELHARYPGEAARSEERRVGKECRSRWSPYH